MPRTKEFTFVVETPLSRPAAERAYRKLVEIIENGSKPAHPTSGDFIGH